MVVEADRVVGALQWVIHEMDSRYKKFAGAGARNIVDYNRKGEDHVPYLVIVIDELADLMMLAPDETERCITRLAQLARATGIHLIIATQRPSVDVVTGLIKANFPARVAFMVASNMDSRVILDTTGAEKLLGKGDMLYQAPDAPAAVRLQGVYVSDPEIQRLVDAWRIIALNHKAEGDDEFSEMAIDFYRPVRPSNRGNSSVRTASTSISCLKTPWRSCAANTRPASPCCSARCVSVIREPPAWWIPSKNRASSARSSTARRGVKCLIMATFHQLRNHLKRKRAEKDPPIIK